ncbi:MAG: hypothetical protein ACYDCO_20020 [Armatimonadota bacterium]
MKIVKWVKRRKWLLLGASLLLLAGVGWSLAHRLWPVCQLQSTSDYYFPLVCDAGFLTRTQPDFFSFYDWHGNKQWHVALHSPDWTGWTKTTGYKESHGHACSLTREGTNLATATVLGDTLQVQHWHKGKRLSENILPVTLTPATGSTRRNYSISYLDDGRVIVRVTNKPDLSIFILKGGHLVAKGELRNVIHLADDGSFYYQDNGRTLSYFSLLVKNRELIAKHQWTVPSLWPRQSITLKNGRLLDPRGTVYGPAGKIGTVSNTLGEYQYLSPDRRYLVFTDWTKATVLSADSLRSTSIVMPPSRLEYLAHQVFPLDVKLRDYNTAISADGRFSALLFYRPGPKVVHLFWSTRWLRPPLSIGVFNRSGKMVATAAVKSCRVPDAIARKWESVTPYYLEPALAGISPDGKAVLIKTPVVHSEDDISNKLALYRRW